jgi:hypothetical protein
MNNCPVMNNFGLAKFKTREFKRGQAVEQSGVPTTKDGNYDFRKRRITNISEPVEPNDAVSKVYFENLILKIPSEVIAGVTDNVMQDLRAMKRELEVGIDQSRLDLYRKELETRVESFAAVVSGVINKNNEIVTKVEGIRPNKFNWTEVTPTGFKALFGGLRVGFSGKLLAIKGVLSLASEPPDHRGKPFTAGTFSSNHTNLYANGICRVWTKGYEDRFTSFRIDGNRLWVTIPSVGNRESRYFFDSCHAFD